MNLEELTEAKRSDLAFRYGVAAAGHDIPRRLGNVPGTMLSADKKFFRKVMHLCLETGKWSWDMDNTEVVQEITPAMRKVGAQLNNAEWLAEWRTLEERRLDEMKRAPHLWDARIRYRISSEIDRLKAIEKWWDATASHS